MRTAILTLMASALASAAWAGSMEDMMKARELGQIVSTADICGYKLDVEKTADFVSSFLEGANDTARASYQSGGGAQKLRMQEMGEVERKVACATQEKMAAKYGLTE